jgi:hypothetical protein
MNTIVTFFLRAKSWQIFLLLFGLMLIAQVTVIASFPDGRNSPESIRNSLLLFGFMTALFMFCYLGWIWSVGSFLNSSVLAALRMRMGWFRFAAIYPAAYFFVFIAFFQAPNLDVFAIILPLHLLAMFCMFYNLYFVSKNLVLAETGKQASFYNFAGPLFLIWFFPIGIWFVQPRINRIYAEKNSAESNGS